VRTTKWAYINHRGAGAAVHNTTLSHHHQSNSEHNQRKSEFISDPIISFTRRAQLRTTPSLSIFGAFFRSNPKNKTSSFQICRPKSFLEEHMPQPWASSTSRRIPRRWRRMSLFSLALLRRQRQNSHVSLLRRTTHRCDQHRHRRAHI
jgi:hypothetical protein